MRRLGVIAPVLLAFVVGVQVGHFRMLRTLTRWLRNGAHIELRPDGSGVVASWVK